MKLPVQVWVSRKEKVHPVWSGLLWPKYNKQLSLLKAQIFVSHIAMEGLTRIKHSEKHTYHDDTKGTLGGNICGCKRK